MTTDRVEYQTIVAVMNKGAVLPFIVTVQAPAQPKAVPVARFAYLADANEYAIVMQERLEAQGISVRMFLR